MATEVIHEHHAHSRNNTNGIVAIIAVLALILLAIFLFQGGFNLGFLGGTAQDAAPQVNVPEQVDVNVNK